MKVIKNESVVMWDIDETLVMRPKQNDGNVVKFVNPYTNKEYWLRPHGTHIELMKVQKSRGCVNIAWSANGYKWAQHVIETLKLQDYVELVITKPIKYFDDLQAEQILGTRVYLEDYDG